MFKLWNGKEDMKYEDMTSAEKRKYTMEKRYGKDWQHKWGVKVADTNLLADPLFYVKIGRLGGLKSRGGGFAAMTPDQRREAGRKGGSMPRYKS